jgi:hypothetical protein
MCLGPYCEYLFSTEEYQAGRVLHPHDLFLLDLYYTYYSPLVYGHDSCHGGVLRHASRRYWPSISWVDAQILLTDRLSRFIE